MDVFHAKVAADLHLKGASTEDAFYDQHGCEWLLFLRTMAKGIRLPKALRYNNLFPILRRNEP